MTLCKAGADVHARAAGRFCGVTPCGQAVQYGHWLIVDYLLRFDKKLNINKPPAQDQPALCIAAQYNQPKSIEVLLKAGADIEITSSDSCTACFTAAREGNLEALEVLYKAGCDVECPNAQGITAVGAVASKARSNCKLHTLKLQLLAAITRLHMQDKRGSFPLLEAAHAYDTRMGALRALLEAGADVNKQTVQGVPLVTAALQGTAAKVKLLLAAGANPRVSVNGQGPLHAAVGQDDHAAMK
eukprot:3489-Heterococcus_DN1.PRE.1